MSKHTGSGVAPGWSLCASILWGVFAAALGVSATLAQEAASPLDNINWQAGPSEADLGKEAQVNVPEGYAFAGADDARTMLEAMGNPTSGRERGILVPASGDWFVVFEYSDVGHVKDDEKDQLDADAILTTIREGNDNANEERERRGWGRLDILGWEQRPQYDPATNNLVWAIRGQSADGLVVNYNTRLLGREGVMEASLVVDPAKLAATLPAFEGLLRAYSYNDGHRYAEFREGDKLAAYGLAALVAGGAAAAAAKSGLLANLFAKFWKLIVVAAVAVGSMFKKVLAALRGEKSSTSRA